MKKLSTLKLIIVGVVLLVGIVVAGLLLSGRLVVAFKNPEASVMVRNSVCSSELIAQYNKTFSMDSQAEYMENLKNISKEVDQLKGADTDPNCVYMQFTYNMKAEDVSKARERLDVLKHLAQQGLYVTGELENPQGLEGAERLLAIIETANDRQPDMNEQGGLSGRG